MYKINDDGVSIQRVDSATFSELGYKERSNLQEWIAGNPEVFGEDLLMISKEFSGFSDTNERLDLLALDRQGNIVVIENKLDDSGRNVVWQSLKYASYCSTLTKANIRSVHKEFLASQRSSETSDEVLCEFFGVEDVEELKLNAGNTQRIIMVAANFRKEITSAVLWLLNYQLRIQCFKVTPFHVGNEHYVNFEQIIPVRDVEEYTISMSEKARDDIAFQEGEKARHQIRRQFWARFLEAADDSLEQYRNINPTKDNWLSSATGISGIALNCVVSRSYARAELFIGRSNASENKAVFDVLHSRRGEIESLFGGELEWERLDAKKGSRIKTEIGGVNYFHEEDWDRMIEFIVDGMKRLSAAVTPALESARRELDATP